MKYYKCVKSDSRYFPGCFLISSYEKLLNCDVDHLINYDMCATVLCSLNYCFSVDISSFWSLPFLTLHHHQHLNISGKERTVYRLRNVKKRKRNVRSLWACVVLESCCPAVQIVPQCYNVSPSMWLHITGLTCTTGKQQSNYSRFRGAACRLRKGMKSVQL